MADRFPLVIASMEKNRTERLRVALDKYQGHDLIDIRVTVALTETSDVQTPTKKGVALAIGKLPELIRVLQEAQAAAERLDWIGGST